MEQMNKKLKDKHQPPTERKLKHEGRSKNAEKRRKAAEIKVDFFEASNVRSIDSRQNLRQNQNRHDAQRTMTPKLILDQKDLIF